MVPNARSLLYRYLLGESTNEEARKIEERTLTDDRREWILGAEAELFAAYVSGCLTLNKRERFENFFLRSEERREKLSLAELLYRYAKVGATQRPDTHSPLLRYFLSEMSPDEELNLEQRLADNERLRRPLKTVRHELIVAYVLKQLSDHERESFERHFLSSEEGVKLLEFAKAVHAYYECIEWVKGFF